MSDLIQYRMMVDCYMFAWDEGGDGFSYRRDARDCQVCFYWCGETDEGVFCSFPNYFAKKIMEESDDDDEPGPAHGWISRDEIYRSSNRKVNE